MQSYDSMSYKNMIEGWPSYCSPFRNRNARQLTELLAIQNKEIKKCCNIKVRELVNIITQS